MSFFLQQPNLNCLLKFASNSFFKNGQCLYICICIFLLFNVFTVSTTTMQFHCLSFMKTVNFWFFLIFFIRQLIRVCFQTFSIYIRTLNICFIMNGRVIYLVSFSFWGLHSHLFTIGTTQT